MVMMGNGTRFQIIFIRPINVASYAISDLEFDGRMLYDETKKNRRENLINQMIAIYAANETNKLYYVQLLNVKLVGFSGN